MLHGLVVHTNRAGCRPQMAKADAQADKAAVDAARAKTTAGRARAAVDAAAAAVGESSVILLTLSLSIHPY